MERLKDVRFVLRDETSPTIALAMPRVGDGCNEGERKQTTIHGCQHLVYGLTHNRRRAPM